MKIIMRRTRIGLQAKIMILPNDGKYNILSQMILITGMLLVKRGYKGFKKKKKFGEKNTDLSCEKNN